MPRQQLDEALAQLQQQLADADHLDRDQIASLRAMVADIQAALEQEEQEERSEPSLAARMREAARHFEDSHPTLTNTVGRVADALAQMGI